MKAVKLPSLILAALLQLFPMSRLIVPAAPLAGSSFAIVSTWIAGAVTLLGSYHAVSGASTTITSAKTAHATNGVPFSYRITTGPQAANRFSAVPLPTGLIVSTTSGRITGIPSVDGVFTILLTASDSGRPDRTVTANLVLTIQPPPGGGGGLPTITAQPQSRTTTNGGSASFSVVAAGAPPLAYQWWFNGAPQAGATNASMTLTGATPGQAGGYSVVITNHSGAVTSSVAMLTVLIPPSITTQPQSQTVAAGSNVTFSVAADGTAPLRRQWRLNGVKLSNATNTTLSINNVQPSQAGNYTVVITNSAGSVTSAVATLTVDVPPVPDVLRPTVQIASPATTPLRVFTNTINLSGTAKDDHGVSNVWVQHNIDAFVPATGTSNWTATLALIPGTNIFRIKATDAADNTSLTNTRVVVYVVTSPLSLVKNGNGKVTALTNGQVLELGKAYSITATPSSGNLFSNWIAADMFSSSPSLKFVMSSNLSLTANFVPNPFLGLKGAYNGLFHPMTSEPPHEQSGFFTLTVTDKGAFTGKLLLAGSTHPIRGQFDLALSARTLIKRVGTNELTLNLQLTTGSDYVTGSVSNAFWSSDLFGYRATFHAGTNPATNVAGKYTMILSGSSDAGTSPFGQGFATLAVSTAGGALFKGSLADGAAVSQKVPVAANGQVPVYLNLHRGKGSLFGWLNVTNTATNDLPGMLLWTKKAGVAGPMNPAGFTNEVLTLGSRYVPPAAGTPTLGFGSGVLLLEGGNLTGRATNEVSLSALNKITVTSTNTNKLVLTLSVPTGLFTGKFVNPQTLRPGIIKGALLQKQNAGGGFFLGTNQSGAVYLGRAEDFPLIVP